MKTSKELADELDAQDRLMARGYAKVKCESCEGKGYCTHAQNQWINPWICIECGGKGWTWKSPTMG